MNYTIKNKRIIADVIKTLVAKLDEHPALTLDEMFTAIPSSVKEGPLKDLPVYVIVTDNHTAETTSELPTFTVDEVIYHHVRGSHSSRGLFLISPDVITESIGKLQFLYGVLNGLVLPSKVTEGWHSASNLSSSKVGGLKTGGKAILTDKPIDSWTYTIVDDENLNKACTEGYNAICPAIISLLGPRGSLYRNMELNNDYRIDGKKPRLNVFKGSLLTVRLDANVHRGFVIVAGGKLRSSRYWVNNGIELIPTRAESYSCLLGDENAGRPYTDKKEEPIRDIVKLRDDILRDQVIQMSNLYSRPSGISTMKQLVEGVISTMNFALRYYAHDAVATEVLKDIPVYIVVPDKERNTVMTFDKGRTAVTMTVSEVIYYHMNYDLTEEALYVVSPDLVKSEPLYVQYLHNNLKYVAIPETSLRNFLTLDDVVRATPYEGHVPFTLVADHEVHIYLQRGYGNLVTPNILALRDPKKNDSDALSLVSPYMTANGEGSVCGRLLDVLLTKDGYVLKPKEELAKSRYWQEGGDAYVPITDRNGMHFLTYEVTMEHTLQSVATVEELKATANDICGVRAGMLRRSSRSARLDVARELQTVLASSDPHYIYHDINELNAAVEELTPTDANLLNVCIVSLGSDRYATKMVGCDFFLIQCDQTGTPLNNFIDTLYAVDVSGLSKQAISDVTKHKNVRLIRGVYEPSTLSTPSKSTSGVKEWHFNDNVIDSFIGEIPEGEVTYLPLDRESAITAVMSIVNTDVKTVPIVLSVLGIPYQDCLVLDYRNANIVLCDDADSGEVVIEMTNGNIPVIMVNQ